MSCDYYCSVAHPHGLVGWSAVCDCGIYWSYSLTFLFTALNTKLFSLSLILVNIDAWLHYLLSFVGKVTLRVTMSDLEVR